MRGQDSRGRTYTAVSQGGAGTFYCDDLFVILVSGSLLRCHTGGYGDDSKVGVVQSPGRVAAQRNE